MAGPGREDRRGGNCRHSARFSARRSSRLPEIGCWSHDDLHDRPGSAAARTTIFTTASRLPEATLATLTLGPRSAAGGVSAAGAARRQPAYGEPGTTEDSGRDEADPDHLRHAVGVAAGRAEGLTVVVERIAAEDVAVLLGFSDHRVDFLGGDQVADGGDVRGVERPVEQGSGAGLRSPFGAEYDGDQGAAIAFGRADERVRGQRRIARLEADGARVGVEQAVLVLNLERLATLAGEVVGAGRGEPGDIFVVQGRAADQGEVVRRAELAWSVEAVWGLGMGVEGAEPLRLGVHQLDG